MTTLVTAHDILDAAGRHLRDRAPTYDSPDGERSMASTVAAFGVITGLHLTEMEGYTFLALLKMVRVYHASGYHADSYEDAAAYLALAGEAEANASALCEP